MSDIQYSIEQRNHYLQLYTELKESDPTMAGIYFHKAMYWDMEAVIGQLWEEQWAKFEKGAAECEGSSNGES